MLFSSRKSNPNEADISLGVVLDVGSGSVGVAIVSSSSSQKYPEILWSYREHLPQSVDTRKGISSAILNTFLELSGAGMKRLREKYPRATIPVIQVSISAPFAHTISRSVSTKSDTAFKVNSALISTMRNKAEEEAKSQITNTLTTRSQSLVTLSEVVTSIKVDGYRVKLPYNGSGQRVNLRQLVSFAPKDLIEEIESARDKVLPRAIIDFDSFMSLYSRALTDIASLDKDSGLISITAEATEVMVIVEGDPLTANFLTQGQHTLARSISQVSELSLAEALGTMKENDINHASLLSAEKVASIKSVMQNYEDGMTALFRDMGNALSMPKAIYLQVDRDSEQFFGETISRALAKATGLKHVIHPFTSEFFVFNSEADPRILCPAYVFHKKLYKDDLAEEQHLI